MHAPHRSTPVTGGNLCLLFESWQLAGCARYSVLGCLTGLTGGSCPAAPEPRAPRLTPPPLAGGLPAHHPPIATRNIHIKLASHPARSRGGLIYV